MRLNKYLNEESTQLKNIMTTTTDHGIKFQTGKKVTFPYMKNTEKSPFMGSTFQQDIEPYGVYMLFDKIPDDKALPNWEKGKITFKNPLVIKFNTKDGISYDEFSWKSMLYEILNKKGKQLTNKLKKLGYDGIVTIGLQKETKEMISL